MATPQSKGIVLGALNERWNSPIIGVAVCLYSLACFAFASLLLSAPFEWGYVLLFVVGAILFGYFEPNRAKNLPVEEEPLPSELVERVELIRKECGVSGLRIVRHEDPSFPDIRLGTDGLKISKRVYEEWSPDALTWALRRNLYKFRDTHSSLLAIVLIIIPFFAVIATSPAKNPNWFVVLAAFSVFLAFLGCGMYFERQQKESKWTMPNLLKQTPTPRPSPSATHTLLS